MLDRAANLSKYGVFLIGSVAFISVLVVAMWLHETGGREAARAPLSEWESLRQLPNSEDPNATKAGSEEYRHARWDSEDAKAIEARQLERQRRAKSVP